jgi:aspartyl/glutamyl-tRNA(Asn/Gln) amidotransferase C subunit
MVRIDLEEVRRMAKLAALELEPQALEALRTDLQRILDYVSLLAEVETGAALPSEPVQPPVPLRPDEPRVPRSRSEYFFKVPRVI